MELKIRIMETKKIEIGKKVSLISGLEFTVKGTYKLGNDLMVESKEGYGDFNINLIKL